jgi:S-adenosylmethionine:tRNA ribosyltransferase-isomerase
MINAPFLHNKKNNTIESLSLPFDLPAELEAVAPPEQRGLRRDEVRLMVSSISANGVAHTQFRQIGDFLQEGDALIINTSGTLNAAIPAQRSDSTLLELHLSTRLPAGLWMVEMRTYMGNTTQPFQEAQPGEVFHLPAGGIATLYAPYHYSNGQASQRLWVAGLDLPIQLLPYLAEYGFPIHYSYVKQNWPSSSYQSVYVTEMGSAEMPSAGRAFTPELLTQLIARGVQIAPLLLHTGVSSLERQELPYEEYYRVPSATARLVNATRAAGQRVIAVGTTVVRALETVTDVHGTTHPGSGWTDLMITPERGLRVVNGLLTGLHEPLSTHLAMLEALAGHAHLEITYREALKECYLWHEFGDLHLILP